MNNTADVGVVNRAFAIDTGKGGKPPRITLKADGNDAEQMLLVARHFGIPVIRDSKLAQRAQCFAEGQPLPRELLVYLLEALKSLSKLLSSRNGSKKVTFPTLRRNI
jgi:type III secretion system FlhB-like substrate exporter